MKIFINILISLMICSNLISQTRENVIKEAQGYKDFEWHLYPNNLLDTGILSGSTANDGIDDRMGKIDANNNGIVTPTEWANALQRWPFVTNQIYQPYTGIAYAWGRGDPRDSIPNKFKSYIKDNKPVLKEISMNTFQQKLNNGKIAGSRSSDYKGPFGINDFTGVDCSGFITRIYDVLKLEHMGTESLAHIAVPDKKLWEMEKGDVFNALTKEGKSGHIIMFLNWKGGYDKKKLENTAEVIHATGNCYEDGKHKRCVIKNKIIVKYEDAKVKIKKNNNWDDRDFYCMSFFPYIPSDRPGGEDGLFPDGNYTLPDKRVQISGYIIVKKYMPWLENSYKTDPDLKKDEEGKRKGNISATFNGDDIKVYIDKGTKHHINNTPIENYRYIYNKETKKDDKQFPYRKYKFWLTPFYELEDKKYEVKINVENELGLKEELKWEFEVKSDISNPYVEWIEFLQKDSDFKEDDNLVRYMWARNSDEKRVLVRFYGKRNGENIIWKELNQYDNVNIKDKDENHKFCFNSDEDIYVIVKFNKEIKPFTPILYFLKEDKKTKKKIKIEGLNLSTDFPNCVPADWLWTIPTGEHQNDFTKFKAIIKKEDLKDINKIKLFEQIENIGISAKDENKNSIDINPETVEYNSEENGLDDTISIQFDNSVETPIVDLWSEKSYAIKRGVVDPYNSFLVKDRIIKVRLSFTNEMIDLFRSAKVKIGEYEAIPLTSEDHLNGWKDYNTKTPVWEGIIDFGEDWKDMENKHYPIYIETYDFARNKSIKTNEKIAYDTIPPVFNLIEEISELIFNPTDGKNGKVNFKIEDNFPNKLILNIRIKDDDGKILMKYDFGFIPASGKIVDINSGEETDVAGIEVITHEGKSAIKLNWDGKDLLNLLTSTLKPHIEFIISDEAGNKLVMNDLKFEFEGLDEMVEQVATSILDKVKDYAKKVVIVDGGFSKGGLEWKSVKNKLFGEGVDIRTVSLNQGDKWASPEDQVAKVKAVMDDFSRNEEEKVVLVGWGTGGLIAQEYLRQYHSTGKVSKLLKISTPSGGVNSAAQVSQGYAIYLVMAPVIKVLDSIGLLDGIMENIKLGEGDVKISGMEVLQKIVRNDQTKNPMNLLSNLLGKNDIASDIQANSDFITKLKSFDPASVGVPVENITTTLWPDMKGEVQAGVVVAIAALGFCGVYTKVDLFSLGNKIFNNIEDEIAEYIVSLIETEIDKKVFLPMWEECEKKIRGFTGRLNDQIGIKLKNIEGIDKGINSKIASFKKFVLKKASAGGLSRQVIDTWCFDNGYSDGFNGDDSFLNSIKTNVEKIYRDMGGFFSNNVLEKVSEVSKIVRQVSDLVNMDFISDALKNKPDWLAKVFGNKFDTAIQDFVKDTVMGDMGDKVTEAIDQYDNIFNEWKGVLNNLQKLVVDLDSIKDNWTEQLDTLLSGTDISLGDVRNALDYVKYFKLAFNGDLAGLLDKAAGDSILQGQSGEFADAIKLAFNEFNNIKNQPMIQAKNLFDNAASALKKPLRDKLKSEISGLIGDFIPPAVKKFKLTVTIPGGFVGLGIMGAAAYLATDYLENTDLVNEGGNGLFISKLMGKRSGQQGSIKMSGWHWGGVQDIGNVLSGSVQSGPRVYIESVNDLPISSFANREGGTLRYFDENEKEKNVRKIFLKEFISSVKYTLIDNFPQMNNLTYSLNYAYPVKLKADSDGNVEMLNPFLLEGLNTLIMEARNGAGGMTRVVYYIILDMMPPQVYPISPRNHISLKHSPEFIEGGIYDKGLDEFDPDRVQIFFKKTPIVGEFSVASLTNDYEKIENADIKRTNFSFEPGPLEEGCYSVKVKVKDETGNESESVWGFYVDMTPPTMEFMVKGVELRNNDGQVTNVIYSPLSGESLYVGVLVKDNISGMVKNVKYSLHDWNNQWLKDLKTYVTKSIGGDYVLWDGKIGNKIVNSGKYRIVGRATDDAGNIGVFTQEFIVDSTPPEVLTLDMAGTGIVNKKNEELTINYTLTEDAGVNFKLVNIIDGTYYDSVQKGYKEVKIDESETTDTNTFSWNFFNPYLDVRDGIYNMEITAVDRAYNRSETYTIEDIRIDRTPPIIFNAMCQPFLVSEDEEGNVTEAVLHYNISEYNDREENKSEFLYVKVDLVESGQAKVTESGIIMEGAWQQVSSDELSESGAPFSVSWDGKIHIGPLNGTTAPDGKYFFRISAVDKNSNEARYYVQLIKGGLPPNISSVGNLNRKKRGEDGSVILYYDETPFIKKKGTVLFLEKENKKRCQDRQGLQLRMALIM